MLYQQNNFDLILWKWALASWKAVERTKDYTTGVLLASFVQEFTVGLTKYFKKSVINSARELVVLRGTGDLSRSDSSGILEWKINEAGQRNNRMLVGRGRDFENDC
jgi:hypothetical protein